MKATLVDVVMCTWNSNRPFFEKCLKSIKREIPVHRFIVVDRFSQDGTIDTIKKHFQLVLVIQSKANLAKARAIGIDHVDTEYFVFMDDDMELPEGWFKRVTSYIDENVGVIHEETFWAGRECMDNSLMNKFVSSRWMEGALAFQSHKVVKMDITSENMLQSVGFTWGGHTIVRTDAVRDWNPSSRISAAEDLLLMKYVVQKGYIWRILEHHTVKHYGPRNLREHIKKLRWHIAGLRATGFTQPFSDMLLDFSKQSIRALRESLRHKEPLIFAYVIFNGLTNIDGYLRWNKFYTMER